MSRIKYRQTPGRNRGHGYFPQLEGLGRACAALSEPCTDRGLTGPAVRDGEQVRELVDKQVAKRARRAAAARKAGLLP